MKIAIRINFFQKVDRNINHTPRAIDAVAYLLAEELVKRNHDVTLFVTSDSETSAHIAPNTFNSQDKDIKFCGDYAAGALAANDPRLHTEHFLNLFQKYRKEGNENIVRQAKDFDIIHTHDLYVKNSLASYVKDIPVPVVTTLHGARMQYRELAPNHSFIAISNAQRKLYPSLPIIGVAYNGIKTDDYEFSADAQNYMAFLGRITPDKGTLDAIEVAKMTKKKLIIAGNLDKTSPIYIKKFHEEIASNPNVTYIGEVDRDQKNTLLKNASVLLMPIHWEEPFGLVAVEALACGTPVIAFRKGALPEIIKNDVNGFIVDNLDQMCAKLDIVRTIERKKCREYVERHFTVSTMTDAYEKLYQQKINNHS